MMSQVEGPTRRPRPGSESAAGGFGRLPRPRDSRGKSLSKMLRMVETERFTFDIDSENAILDCTLELWSDTTFAFQVTLVVADSDKLPMI